MSDGRRPYYVGKRNAGDDDAERGAAADESTRFSHGVTDGTRDFHDDAPYIPLTPRLADAIMIGFALIGILVFALAVPDEESCTHSPVLQWLLVISAILIEFWVAYYVWIMYVWKGGLHLNKNWGFAWDMSGD